LNLGPVDRVCHDDHVRRRVSGGKLMQHDHAADRRDGAIEENYIRSQSASAPESVSRIRRFIDLELPAVGL
jgi:hypothetical protein